MCVIIQLKQPVKILKLMHFVLLILIAFLKLKVHVEQIKMLVILLIAI